MGILTWLPTVRRALLGHCPLASPTFYCAPVLWPALPVNGADCLHSVMVGSLGHFDAEHVMS